MSNIYIIYDNLYEEYQMPFVMKNDNIAKIEFNIFLNNAINKAPENEKENTKKRFILCKYNFLTFYPEDGKLFTATKYSGIPEPVIIGENENE